MSQQLTKDTFKVPDPYEAAVSEHIPSAGDYYADKNPSFNGFDILLLKTKNENGLWVVESVIGRRSTDTISDETLKTYYRPILNNLDEILRRAHDVANGDIDSLKSIAAAGDTADTEALMAGNSPEQIRALHEESCRIANYLKEVRLVADILIEKKKYELEQRLRDMSSIVTAMEEKISAIVKVITILNLYTGKSVELHQICEGEPAPSATPLSLRQRILYMDEELCADIDYEADYNDVDLFFEWLARPENRNIIVPEAKCIVALKPKRFNMDYRSGDPTYDNIRNQWNKHTFIVLRNGDNLWWAESDDLELYDSAFPHEDYEEKLRDKAKDNHWIESLKKEYEAVRYRTTKYAMFIQGIIDQKPGLLSTEQGKTNLLKLEGVELIRDDEPSLGTGLLSWPEFVKEKNTGIRHGTRIVYAVSRRDWSRKTEGCNSGKPLKYYCHDYSVPDFPVSGIYNAEQVNVVVGYKNHHAVMGPYKDLVFKYLPGDTVYSRNDIWEGHERKKKVSWVFNRNYVINYDAVTLDELIAYMNDRSQRVHFASMMPLLKKVIKIKKDELEKEQAFKALMKETLKKDGFQVTDNVIDEAVTWWKTKVIFSRPLTSDDAKAWRMIFKRIAK